MNYLDNYFNFKEEPENPFELKENEVLLFCVGHNINDTGNRYPIDFHGEIITGISEILIPFQPYTINEPGYYGDKIINDRILYYFKKIDYPGIESKDGIDYILDIDQDLYIYENIKSFQYYAILKAEVNEKNRSVKNAQLLRKQYVQSECISKDTKIKITHKLMNKNIEEI